MDVIERGGVPLDSYEQRALQLAWRGGALDTLRRLELITLDEYVLWHERFAETLGLPVNRN